MSLELTLELALVTKPKRKRRRRKFVSIWGQSPEGNIEKIETCDKEMVEVLLREFRRSFYGWKIWSGKKDEKKQFFV